MDAMFCGVGCALVTPFRNGQVDLHAFQALIDRQTAAGTDALVVLGTTGEPSTLTEEEMCALVRHARAGAPGSVPVIAGVCANATRTAVRRARLMRDCGADALLCVTPYYNRANQEGLTRHFTQIADAADAPVILYNVPSRTGVNLLPETAEALSRHPNIRGLKEANPDISQLAADISACGDDFSVYAGNDEQIPAAVSMGARGVISVIANVAPAETNALARAALRGDRKRTIEIYYRLWPLMRALASDINPIPAKAALSLMGLISDEVRLPLTPLPADRRAALRRALAACGQT